jgi:hypothetical protein
MVDPITYPQNLSDSAGFVSPTLPFLCTFVQSRSCDGTTQQGAGDGPHAEAPWERKCARAILRLAHQFPGDTGAMAPLFLNYLLIAPVRS